MDKEDSSINFTGQFLKQNCTYASKDTYFKDNAQYKLMIEPDKISNNSLKFNNGSKNNSCDNFQNMIVTYESNTSINALSRFPSPQNGYFQPLKSSLPKDDCTSGDIGHIEKNVKTNNWEHIGLEPLSHLIYMHYFNSDLLPKRVTENSKPNKNGVESTNHKSLPSAKGN